MEREIKKRLQDILYAIERLDIHLQNYKSFKDYKGNVTVKAATERELGIIGEAVTQIRKVQVEIELSGIQKIISFRNLIIHAYDSVKMTRYGL